MDYPLEMRSERALGILGRLIFDWAEDPARLPPGAREEDGRIVLDVETFHGLLQREGLVQGDPGGAGGDYAVRVDITAVELIRRSPERASILLPERHVVTGYRAMTGPVEAPVVRLYKRVADAHAGGEAARLPEARASAEDVHYGTVPLAGDPLEAFIYPNTAYYSCTQCL
jgi:hypothetical protein